MMRSESTSAFGQPSETKPTFGVRDGPVFALAGGAGLAAARRARAVFVGVGIERFRWALVW